MTTDIAVQRYESGYAGQWNKFTAEAKNPLFMFHRNYMDYHKDRFKDHSLMFLSKETNEIAALLPASEKDGMLISHGGLTYGGLILNERAKQHTVNRCFDAMVSYLKSEGFCKMLYKTVPHIYHEQPCEEDLYALYRSGGIIKEVAASTVINLSAPLKMPKGRKSQISRAKREGVQIRECKEKEFFDRFIDLENEVLESRHKTHAVHSSDELFYLYKQFPMQIHLFAAFLDNAFIAGTVVFEYSHAVHTQYMAADDTARRIGALDLIIDGIIEKYKHSKLWLDFGISTEDGGRYLNEGLISQKEGFGGRTNVYELWELNLK